MAAQLISETELIDVSSISMLIYGPPGAGKTSLAQTADNPITLDFDRGAHRAANRRAVMRFDSWNDVGEAQAEIVKRKTVVVDTIGRLLDMLSADIIAKNAKHGSAAGGLSLQGFGALKSRFATWINQLRLAGKDLVMIAHEKEEKDGDDRIMRPDIQGGSYVECMKFTDLVGYLSLDRQGKRVLDFNPSDKHLGKNAAGWGPANIPALSDSRDCLAAMLADAKAKIGKTAEASAAIAKIVDEWAKRLASLDNLGDLNGILPDLASLKNGTKKQVWHLIKSSAAALGGEYDSDEKAFLPKQEAA